MTKDIEYYIKLFKLNPIKILSMPDSFSSQVFKLFLTNEERVYIKIPYSDVKKSREVDALTILQDYISVPRILDVQEEALLLSEIEGESLRGQLSQKLAYEVGVSHAMLHSVPLFKRTSVENVYDGWIDFISNQFYSFAKDVRSILSENVVKQSIQIFEQLKDEQERLDGPCFIHMDFRPANIIIKDDRVTGIIDFESSRYGATQTDFTKLYRDVFAQQPDCFDSYKEGYRSVRPLIDLDKAIPFYTFTDSFNSIGWAVRRGITKHQIFLNENLERLYLYINNLTK